MAKYKPEQYSSITRPILKDIVKRAKNNLKVVNPEFVKQRLDQPTALYQDAGSAYNSRFVFPQL